MGKKGSAAAIHSPLPFAARLSRQLAFARNVRQRTSQSSAQAHLHAGPKNRLVFREHLRHADAPSQPLFLEALAIRGPRVSRAGDPSGPGGRPDDGACPDRRLRPLHPDRDGVARPSTIVAFASSRAPFIGSARHLHLRSHPWEVPMRNKLILSAVAIAAVALLASFTPRNGGSGTPASVNPAATLAGPALPTSIQPDAF